MRLKLLGSNDKPPSATTAVLVGDVGRLATPVDCTREGQLALLRKGCFVQGSTPTASTLSFRFSFSQTNLKIQHRVVRRALSSEVPSLIPTASTTSTTTSTSTTAVSSAASVSTTSTSTSTSTTSTSTNASVSTTSTTSTSTSTTASAVQIRRAAADRYPLPNVKPKKKYCQLFHSFIT